MTNGEKLILKAYLELPTRKLLNHQFELSEDFLAGYVSRFLKGESFKKQFQAFSKEESEIINTLINKHYNEDDGKDLLTAYLLSKTVCNILNKYQEKWI